MLFLLANNMKKIKNIAVVVPFYNEADNLFFFIKEWQNIIFKKKFKNYRFHFFFINDGSTDNFHKYINKNFIKFDFKIISKKNSGHGNSCVFGLNHVLKNYRNFFSCIMQVDSDNQCDPSYLKNFLDNFFRLNCSYHIFGHRVIREDGYLRVIFSKILSIIILLRFMIFIKDANSPYRLYSINDLEKSLNKINNNYKLMNIDLKNVLISILISTKIRWIKVNFRDRKFGNSKYKFADLYKQLKNLILNQLFVLHK